MIEFITAVAAFILMVVVAGYAIAFVLWFAWYAFFPDKSDDWRW